MFPELVQNSNNLHRGNIKVFDQKVKQEVQSLVKLNDRHLAVGALKLQCFTSQYSIKMS
jgi:hypothetical protein